MSKQKRLRKFSKRGRGAEGEGEKRGRGKGEGGGKEREGEGNRKERERVFQSGSLMKNERMDRVVTADFHRVCFLFKGAPLVAMDVCVGGSRDVLF